MPVTSTKGVTGHLVGAAGAANPVGATPASPGAVARPSLALGFSHSCLLGATGTVRCWGANADGQLGDTTLVAKKVPTTVTGLTAAIAITAGANHTCALLANGTAKCWGYNIWGQLGNGNIVEQHVPVAVTVGGVPLTGITDVAAGWLYTCSRIADGTGRCWGLNSQGQLGVAGSSLYIKSPTALKNTTTGNLTGIAAIAVGESHACTRQADGTGRCWGYNIYGQVGDNTTSNRNQPTTVAGLGGVTLTAVTANGDHSCARTAGGNAKCWGDNANGSIGDGTLTDRLVPTTVTGAAGSVAAVGTGRYHSCSLASTSGALCWGDNRFGQLGDNTVVDRTTPVAVVGL